MARAGNFTVQVVLGCTLAGPPSHPYHHRSSPEAACMIAGRLSITSFTASHGYIRGFLKPYDICNIAVHGQAGGANIAEAAAAVEDTRRKLESFPPDCGYNIDETGLLYK